MQGDKHAVKAFIMQGRQRFVRRVKGMGIHPLPLQGRQDGLPAHQGNFTLGGGAAKHHCYFAKSCHFTVSLPWASLPATVPIDPAPIIKTTSPSWA